MNRLLLLTKGADSYHKHLLENDLPDLEIVTCDSVQKARDIVHSYNIIFGSPYMLVDVLNEATHLEWVQSTFAGVDALCVPGLRRDYILTGVKDIFGPLMSEYVMAYILALERHLFETRKNQLEKTWDGIPYSSLNELTIGVCGLGSIGRHIAQTAAHFGMRVIAYERMCGDYAHVDQVFTGDSFTEFLGIPDYLILVLPRTPATTGLINAGSLRRMKSSAVLINVGRGNAVVEDDLAEALRDGVIRAAVLDVFEEEPLPASSTLWTLPNAYITPHNAAFSFPSDIVRIFSENYQRFLQKKPMKYVIDFERGY